MGRIATAQTFLIKLAMHNKVKPKYICKARFNMIKGVCDLPSSSSGEPSVEIAGSKNSSSNTGSTRTQKPNKQNRYKAKGQKDSKESGL